MFEKLANWLTPVRRKEIQGLTAIIVPVLVAGGLLSESTATQVLIIIAALFQFGASLLSVLNLEARGGSESWTLVRGAIYTLGAGVAPALLALGVFDETSNAVFTTILSLVLTVTSSILAIITSNKQYTQ